MADITISFSDLDAGEGVTKLATFSGQLDETNIEEEAMKVYDVMEKEKVNNFVFDFTKLTYLNSKSVGYLADWQSKVSQSGGKLIIFGAAENIFDILDVVGLTKLIEMVDDFESAKAAL